MCLNLGIHPIATTVSVRYNESISGRYNEYVIFVSGIEVPTWAVSQNPRYLGSSMVQEQNHEQVHLFYQVPLASKNNSNDS